MVETPTIVAGFERPVPGNLVVHAENRLVLAIGLHARRDRLPRTKVDVFNQRNFGRCVDQGWRGGWSGEVGLRGGRAVRACTAVHVGYVEIGGTEPAARIGAKRVAALLEGLRAPRRLGKQELHYVVDHAITAEDLHLAVAGWIPGSSQARRNLVPPTEID